MSILQKSNVSRYLKSAHHRISITEKNSIYLGIKMAVRKAIFLYTLDL